MHTKHDEQVQELLCEIFNDEPYQLNAAEAKALRDAGINARAGQWIVIHIDDYSQSHWIVDNVQYIGNHRQAQRIADELSDGDNW